MTTTKLNDLFDNLEPEKGNKLDDKIQIEKDEKVNELIELFQSASSSLPPFYTSYNLEHIPKLVRQKYSSDTITKFSLNLNHEKNKPGITGIFLNHLIQTSEDNQHLIHTNHLNYKLDFLGYKNTKEITIIGDVGDEAGEHMQKGKIIVNGSSGERLGLGMCGGTIIVEGSCKQDAAAQMRDGEIIIKGDAGRNVGCEMKRGVVKIYGNIESLRKNIFGGDIYHKDNLIVRDGKILDSSYLEW